MSKLLNCIYILFISNNIFSQIIYSNECENLKITNQIYYLEDKNSSYSINDVIKKNNFQIINKKVPNFGITTSSIWLKFTIKNNTKNNNLLLNINQPIIDEIEFYTQDSTLKSFNKKIMGEFLKFNHRKYNTPEFIFDLNIPYKSCQTFYLKVKCKENMQIPISIGTILSMFNQSVLNNIASGIYMGIMVVMILYNFFIYRIFKDKSYILYSIYIIFTMLTQISLQGYTFQFLWPNFPWLAINSPFLFPSLVSVSGLLFFNYFLHVKERNNTAYKISFIFFIPYTVSIILSFIGHYNISFMIMEITSTLVSAFMLTVAYNIYKKGFYEARFFLIGWSIFLIDRKSVV